MNNPSHINNNFHVLDILLEMRNAKLPPPFVNSLMEYCQKYEGIRDLMEMWFEESELEERDNIISDLQSTLDDIANAPDKVEYFNFDFNDMDAIRKDVENFKKKLRAEVDRQGGISELSRRTGIPQPSLSRFFSSKTMPRQTTIFKILKALNLSQSIFKPFF